MHKIIYLLLFVLSVAACKSPEARRPVQRISGSFIKESAERNKELYQQEEAIITELIAQNPETDFETSPNGFWYFYNKKDTLSSTMPKKGDVVTFTYDVKNLEGTTIVSEAENGLQQYQVDESNQELISGIKDGIKLMKEGETVTFIFPSYKAFGYYGIVEKLATNTPIQSTVTLQSIEITQEN
ncbi:MAG TPA: gliding motility-associated peptidyl-prolyl isomerase GldI [Flavobacteriaceae bacterium]|jgi:gliding motility-associated peptidyl-prolyl isomerase|nr:gliding motility-associated peptidyl-prolyl isomerase GldI [Flavobacteriaceae bacterium]MAM29617.1 gliding motility-associated peptidyl-prolyl isomerase GldI [Flavobacteriaceae bacterium]MAY53591.1 gliding motility-associated peptidyl-prolyl isomerase GldI [Flavobacteriaceae bacterium]HBR54382.1 gliding motility-associated peptidyl-prolyl isomerase GldI [Flavobacteriaceae bacterium]HIB46816.1 gliding motility-associated peptidyl-prolyl isomerase GldI [Flavobacteriaceae bacterium]|tara:strand:- start:430 stop:981 length:552 start_codon:yes stop_codon:yes gene_type:complete